MIHFYCFNQIRTILITNHPIDEVRKKYGYKYEIINSIKDHSVLDIIKARTIRQYPGYTCIDWEVKVRKIRTPITEETRQKMRLAKLGLPRPIESNMKTSRTMKGHSNFEGKRHTWESKEKIGFKMLDNDNVKDTYWINNPQTSKEKRVRSRHHFDPNYQLGRDYYAMEPLIMSAKRKKLINKVDVSRY